MTQDDGSRSFTEVVFSSIAEISDHPFPDRLLEYMALVPTDLRQNGDGRENLPQWSSILPLHVSLCHYAGPVPLDSPFLLSLL